MPRILGVDIPKDKRIEASLQYIYGIGPKRAKDILSQIGMDPSRRAKEISEEEISKITSVIQNDYITEGDLRREVGQNVKRLMDIGTYRGLRHRKRLPARGQRTKTNARTRKGKRPQVGGKKRN